MNKVDNDIYQALKFYSKYTIEQILEIKSRNPASYYKNVSQIDEDLLHQHGWIHLGEIKNASPLTNEGLNQLRTLEKIKLDNKAIWISTISLFISIISIIKSMNWI